MSTDHTTLAGRFFEESDRRRTPGELCGAGFTAHFPGFPAMDMAAYDQFAAMFHAPFSDIKHPIDEVIGDGDKVAVRLRFEGTHTGQFMGVPASGRHFSVEGTAFLHVGHQNR
jgi:hypothetical protein